jgi:DNA processing protein
MKQAFREKRDWLYAACLGLATSQKIARLIPHSISRPADLFEMDQAQLTALGFKAKQIKALHNPDAALMEQELARLQQFDCEIVTLDDPNYPDCLRFISVPPLLLYIKGDKQLLNTRQLAMVGSRRPSYAAQEMGYAIAKTAAAAGITITSGLALGIDGAAHKGALAASGKTIAVVATGLDQIYPARHKKLFADIVAKGGLIISEHCFATPPNGSYFPQRNRIISALSQAVLVVEAALRSGSLVTARHALEQGRELLAIPSSPQNLMATGSNTLIKQGAKVVTSAEDILQEFSSEAAMQEQEAVPVIYEATREVEKLLKTIDFEVTPVDVMVARSGLSARIIAGRLAELALRGQVQAMPGGYAQVQGA